MQSNAQIKLSDIHAKLVTPKISYLLRLIERLGKQLDAHVCPACDKCQYCSKARALLEELKR